MDFEKCIEGVKLVSKAVGTGLTAGEIHAFSTHLIDNYIDPSKPIFSYMLEMDKPVGKDQMRIYDIVRKSQPQDGKVIISRANKWKMEKLAFLMNSKIKDEGKREARKAACIKYGLIGLAKNFN